MREIKRAQLSLLTKDCKKQEKIHSIINIINLKLWDLLKSLKSLP